MDNQPNNPLHGVKLADIVTKLQEKFGWEGLAAHVDVRCFQNEPSVKSSLKFLRKTPWAREKVEQLYVDTFFNTQEDDMATFQWKSIKK